MGPLVAEAENHQDHKERQSEQGGKRKQRRLTVSGAAHIRAFHGMKIVGMSRGSP